MQLLCGPAFRHSLCHRDVLISALPLFSCSLSLLLPQPNHWEMLQGPGSGLEDGQSCRSLSKKTKRPSMPVLTFFHSFSLLSAPPPASQTHFPCSLNIKEVQPQGCNLCLLMSLFVLAKKIIQSSRANCHSQ